MTFKTDVLWNETKNAVKEVVKKYLYYDLSIDSGSQIKLNKDLMLCMIDKIGLNSKYIKLNDSEIENRISFINYVRFSYNKLNSDERKIIYWTFFDKEKAYDDSFIANDLGFSLGYYYIKKKEAIIKFAYSLGVEAIKQ